MWRVSGPGSSTGCLKVDCASGGCNWWEGTESYSSSCSSPVTIPTSSCSEVCDATPAGKPGMAWYARNGGPGPLSSQTPVYIRLQYKNKDTGHWGPLGPTMTKNYWHPSYHGPMFQGPTYSTGVSANSGAGGVPYNTAKNSGYRMWRVSGPGSSTGCLKVDCASGGCNWWEPTAAYSTSCPSPTSIATTTHCITTELMSEPLADAEGLSDDAKKLLGEQAANDNDLISVNTTALA